MTDRHIRILRLVAHQAQRELDDHHSLDRIGDTASTGRREHLERAAARTRARVVDADERRRNDDQFPTPDLVSGDAPRVLVRVAHHARQPGSVLVELDDLLRCATVPSPDAMPAYIDNPLLWGTRSGTRRSRLS